MENMRLPINQFDFDSRKCVPYIKTRTEHELNVLENKYVTLRGLQYFCMSCRLCSLGCKLATTKDNKTFDPHVFSNMRYDAQYMIIGQNPGVNECIIGTPFVGQAGQNFDKALEANKLDRSMFYITNIVKCFTQKPDGSNNREPTFKEKENCATSILVNEIKTIRPKLLITLGASAFNFFCPELQYSKHVGDIVECKYGKLYAIYHPSPLNINAPDRRKMFEKQIMLLAKLINYLG